MSVACIGKRGRFWILAGPAHILRRVLMARSILVLPPGLGAKRRAPTVGAAGVVAGRVHIPSSRVNREGRGFLHWSPLMLVAPVH